MAARSRSTFGIEIGKAALCIAQYQPEDGSVVNLSYEQLDGTGVEWWAHVQDKLKRLVAEMRLAGQDAVCSVSAESVVIKRLGLDKDEPSPRDAIQWEISQHIIGSMDEYALDSEKTSEGLAFEPARYLVVACRNADVSRIATLLRSQKVNPTIVDVDIFAAINAFEANYPDNLSTPSFILLGSDDYTKVALTVDGRFLDHEYFKNGAGGLDPEKYAAAVRSACAQLKQANLSVVGSSALPVYATGPVFSDHDFCSRCLRELGKADVLNPFKKVGCSVSMPPEELQKQMPRFAVAVGLSLRAPQEKW